ncbi:hypothetical protein [Sinorhizobium meliloti]|uniref:hypothetical protein n=1 Tax=Rhizobium meliloti TaxID=382 RepID=UPI003F1534F8
MDQHIAALWATADAVHVSNAGIATTEVTSVAYANALLGVGRKEEAGRLAIINYTPRDYREAKLKLTYLAAYLIATGSTLTANEMDAVLEATRDRSSALVS